MKAIALAALAIPMMTAPALAGPYVMTKSELKFSDANYKEAVNQARLGYDWKVGALKPYVELGGGAKTPDGGSSRVYSLFFESISMVTGPSFNNSTFMSAPKTPVCMCFCSALSKLRMNFSYKGIAISGLAAFI